MKKTRVIESRERKQLVGKLLMMAGALGILILILAPFFVIRGCFGYDFVSEALMYLVPTAMLIIGYKIYSKYE